MRWYILSSDPFVSHCLKSGRSLPVSTAGTLRDSLQLKLIVIERPNIFRLTYQVAIFCDSSVVPRFCFYCDVSSHIYKVKKKKKVPHDQEFPIDLKGAVHLLKRPSGLLCVGKAKGDANVSEHQRQLIGAKMRNLKWPDI